MKAILVRLTNKVFQTTRPVPRGLCLALLALLVLGVPRAQAAIAVVDSTGGSVSNTVLAISQAFTVTSGNVLVVNLSYRGPNNVYPAGPTTLDWVTSSGTVTQTMTRAVQQGNTAATAIGSSIYYLWNPLPDASGTISGSLPASYVRQVISAYTLSGVDTNALPIVASSDAGNVNTGTSVTSTNMTGVPLGGFASMSSAMVGATATTGFTANTGGSGTAVNWFVSGVSGAAWNQGYIPSLASGISNFSIAYSGTANRLHIVAAIFTPAVSASPTPTLIGQNATAITTTTATLGAIVVTNGTSTITNYGIVYAPTAVNPAPTVGGASVTQLVKGTTQTLGAFTTNATGLTPGTRYSYAGYAQNASGTGYSDVGIFYAVTNEPTIQATGVSFSSAQRSAFTFSWTRGNGNNCLVLLKADSAVTGLPVDGTTYTADANFAGAGSVIGASAKVVYLGTGNSVTVSNLTIGTTYYVAVFEVNGAGGPENYLTNSPATGNQTATGNLYYSVNTGLSPAATTSWTNSLGANPANFTGGDTFIIQNGHSLTPPGSWTLMGGATLQINSGGTLDMQYDLNKLFIQGSFVNNGSFLKSIDTGTPPSVNFTNVSVAGGGTAYASTLTVGSNYTVNVLAIGAGGGGAGANNPSNAVAIQGGGGGGGASAYSTNLLLQAGNAYEVTVGGNGGRGTATGGGGWGGNGVAGSASSFGGGFLTTLLANGGGAGLGATFDGTNVTQGVDGAGGAAGSSGNAANYAGGNAAGGGGGGAAGDAGAGTGGSGGSGVVAQGGAGGSVTANTAGAAGGFPGGGGSGANWTSGTGKAAGVGGVGLVNVQFISVSTAPNTANYRYQSRQNGDWNDFNTWSVNTGSGFVNAIAGQTPNAGHSNVVVQAGHTVTVASNAVTINLTVNSGGTLTVNGSLAVNRLTGQTITNNLTVNGTLNLAVANALVLGNNTTNLVATGAVLNQTAAAAVSEGTGVQLTINGTYIQNVTGGGVIPVATWATNSTCQIDSTFTNTITGAVALNYGQAFGNFTWNALSSVPGTNFQINIKSVANNAINSWNITGNLTVNDPSGTNGALLNTGSGVMSNSVAGNVVMTGGIFKAGTTAGSTFAVGGSISVSNASYQCGSAVSSVQGNVSFTGTADVTGGSSGFVFAKAGAQAWTATTTNALTAPAWVVNSGSAVTLGSASQCVVSDLTVNGTVAVSGNSTLVVNGTNVPSASNAGSITVASGSALGGNGAIGASVTYSAGAFATNTIGFDSNNVVNTALTLTNAMNLNGNTCRVSTGTNVLGAGDYLLITNTIGGITGSFASSPVISGAGLTSGTAGTVVTTANAVKLHVAVASSLPPTITSTVRNGSNLIISGTNTSGSAGGTYYVRAYTNVTTSVTNWPRISTNTYGVGGAFAVTNQVVPGIPANFYRIEQ